MSIDKNKVTELLRDYRSYRYASVNCGPGDDTFRLASVYSERRINLNAWDATRYNRIVNMIDGAINDVLSDDERMVIMRKYIDRNPISLNDIADAVHKDPSVISRFHTAAIRRLAIALKPLTYDEREIENFDHMFDKNWRYQEQPAS